MGNHPQRVGLTAVRVMTGAAMWESAAVQVVMIMIMVVMVVMVVTMIIA